MNQDKDNESIQTVFGQFDENKCVVWSNIQLQHKSKNAQAHCIKPPTKIIPVIFLPGIMGSNLKSKKNKKSIWRMRDGYGGLALDALGWVLTGAKRRKELLNPETTVTDFDQEVRNNDAESNYFPSRQQRGWGSALQFSYIDSLEGLQQSLLSWELTWEALKSHGKLDPTFIEDSFSQTIFGSIINQQLSSSDDKPLTQNETERFQSLLFPLHVFGYNWLQDNATSAQALSEYIDKVIKMYDFELNGGKGHGLAFEDGKEKVILVTHSMGGLVSRYASECLDAACKDKILGIVHGVMPDLGSATTYKMMKIGEQTAMGWVIGGSAKRLMSVLAQSPAPMQLLPSAKYNHGRPWLKIEKGSQDGKTDIFLPQNGDPFNEIYLRSDVWWRMYEPDILDSDSKISENNYKKYRKVITYTVSPFIKKMDGQYHSNTYLFYGAHFDKDTPKDPRRSDETLTWKSQNKNSWLWVSGDSRQTEEYGDKREYSLLQSNNYWDSTQSLQEEGGAGDGTVPIVSINLQHPYKEILKTNVGHQAAYQFAPWQGDDVYGIKNEISPAIKFTLRSLCRIVQSKEINIG
ncbi:lipase family alpha/beta hydrolase [Providencia burhodogranariea]|uniref:Lecithin:cholesterol acyltransferase n=1 Tax=Providencia burhodogranariea DSM 19968 TaxID=1141662 RepID=K8WV23_9GAMM|nr:hypothetical protein OOA_02742 [Providencia burhodogranariea DSM 19968]